MTPAREDMAQIASNGTALALTTALLAVMFATRSESWRDSSALPVSRSEPGIEVTLQPATAETPPAPQPPPPVPRKAPAHRMTPQQAQVAQVPVPAELQPMPVERDPVPEGGALVAASGAPASTVPTNDYRPDLEAQYAAGLRADIDRRTHPPDSAQYRLHRPSGEVRVAFIVTRNGEPKVVRVLRSSGSPILDDAAVAIVSSGHYPPMPTKVFAGEAEHVFAVTIEFRAAVS
jgi:periplasmic protein TonB